MVFTSHIFIFYFLPLALILYYAMKGSRRLVALTAMSYVFYAWNSPWFLLILGWTTLCDFISGNLIDGHWRIGRSTASSKAPIPLWQRRLFLTVSLTSNLGLLFAFKYCGFAIENLNALGHAVGLVPITVLRFALPVGISFYTFESISYVVDIYRGRARSASASAWKAAFGENNLHPGFWPAFKVELRALLHFACYISQFPHLVAGPIIRFRDLEPQFYNRPHTIEKFARGVVFVCLGVGKKILIADTLGEAADYTFNSHPIFPIDAWFGLFAYAFQIYFDFSGYSDIAIGLGLMFGFEFARNFDSPYKAASITEFWRRWHISLSTWLRDYLYIELGGNRKGQSRTCANLAIVMLLGGLWHGASWTFMAWGGVHGGWLILERKLGKQSFYARAPLAFRVGLTFLIVCFAWVFFRSNSFASAVAYFKCMFGCGHIPVMSNALMHVVRDPLWTRAHVVCLIIGALLAFGGVQTWNLSQRFKPVTAAFALMVFLASLGVMSVRSYSPFLYFRF